MLPPAGRQAVEMVGEGGVASYMITGSQIRMARAALGWTVTTLAEKADVTWARLQHIEREDGVPSARPETMEKLRATLEANGVLFLAPEAGTGPGVRLSKEADGA